MTKIENKECYVAFLDILGFKQYVNNNKEEDILNMFFSIKGIKEKLKKSDIALGRDKDDIDKLHSSLYFYIMSDSIILAIEKNIDGAYDFILNCCREVQRSLLFNYNILLRGGVSFGLFYGVDEVNFGKGFIKAYELEGEARYPRIIIDPELVNAPPKSSVRTVGTHNSLLDYDNPNDGYVHILYLEKDDGEELKNGVYNLINEGLKAKEKAFKENYKVSIKEKYIWLQKYVDETIEEYNSEVKYVFF